jgi:superfamily II DNA/RNA helicase
LPALSVSPASPSSGPDLAALGLAPGLVRAAAAAGWAPATPIQAAAIPAILDGRDLLGVAPTGSGKTAAFLLPLLQRLLAGPHASDRRPRRLRALILAPTRELAAQIGAAAQNLAPQLKTVVAVGGLSINPQMMALRGGAHLVVATPGRMLDLLEQHALQLSDVELLVLDEADRLLDPGFAEETAGLLARLPVRRQTLMFTATMPAAVAELAARLLHDPLRVELADASSAAEPAIAQRAIEVDTARRTPLLRHLVRSEGWDRVLVFVATQYATEHVADKLRQAGVPAAALHGRLSPGRRSQSLADFQNGALAVLVATDLAARGLDIAGLSVVVNHDLPRSAADHTHRIGRTGRAGAAGLAVSFVLADAPGSEAHFRLLENRLRQRVPREQVPGYEPAPRAAPPAPADPTGGVKGRRKSKKDKLREAAALQRR